MSDLDSVTIPTAHPIVALEHPLKILDLRRLTDPYFDADDDSLSAALKEQRVKEEDITPLADALKEAEVITIPDPFIVKFVLNSVVDFLDELVLSGEQLKQASQLQKDIIELVKEL